MLVIVDYGMGNLKSVEKAVRFLGKRAKITSDYKLIKKAKKIIFPGVGHFGKAVKELKKRKIFSLLKERIKEGIHFLGICLGMQLLLEESEEAPRCKGLGIIRGKARVFKGRDLVVPHMGWNQVNLNSKKIELFKGIKNKSYFYFVHSYYCELKEKITVGTTFYGKEFVSFFNKENIWAVQFHPEKSQNVGLKLLANFLNL
jgi:glutamine amidotransferase